MLFKKQGYRLEIQVQLGKALFKKALSGGLKNYYTTENDVSLLLPWETAS